MGGRLVSSLVTLVLVPLVFARSFMKADCGLSPSGNSERCPMRPWRPRLLPACGSLLTPPAVSNAAELRQQTVEAWDGYVRAAASRLEARLGAEISFLIHFYSEFSRDPALFSMSLSDLGCSRGARTSPLAHFPHFLRGIRILSVG